MASCCFVIPWLGESKWTPCPHLPPPPLIPPSLPLPTAPLLFSHYSIPTYILQRLFVPSQCLHSLYTSPAPSPSFSLFGSFLAIPLLPAPSSIITHLLPLFPKAFYPLPDPPYPPTPACPPCPHFRFFEQFMDAFLHVFLFYYIYTCTYMIYCIE